MVGIDREGAKLVKHRTASYALGRTMEMEMSNFFTWGMITAIVGFFVWITQERKLRFDLFNRRLEAYESMREALWKYQNDVYNVTTEREASDEFYDELERKSELIEMLFPEHISKKTKEILSDCTSIYFDKWDLFLATESSPYDPSEKEVYFGSKEQKYILAKVSTENRGKVIRGLNELRELVVPYLKQRTAMEWLYDGIAYLRDRLHPTSAKDQNE